MAGIACVPAQRELLLKVAWVGDRHDFSSPLLVVFAFTTPTIASLTMLFVGTALAALACLAAGESLKKLDTSLTILTSNDLQGRLQSGVEYLQHNLTM